AAIASAQMPRAPHDAPVASSLTPVPVAAAPLPPAADLAAMAPAAAPSVAVPVAAQSSALQSALQRAGVTARRGGADGYEWDNGPVRGKARAARGGNALAASQSYMNAQR